MLRLEFSHVQREKRPRNSLGTLLRPIGFYDTLNGMQEETGIT